MTDLADTVVSEFASRFENITAKLHKWVDPLSNQQFWRNPYPYGNSIGHLVLHLTGNLSTTSERKLPAAATSVTAIANSPTLRARTRTTSCETLIARFS